jgi:hypothetical protein
MSEHAKHCQHRLKIGGSGPHNVMITTRLRAAAGFASHGAPGEGSGTQCLCGVPCTAAVMYRPPAPAPTGNAECPGMPDLACRRASGQTPWLSQPRAPDPVAVTTTGFTTSHAPGQLTPGATQPGIENGI